MSKIKERFKKVGHKLSQIVSEYGNDMVNGAILGFAIYGASEFTWSLIGGRKFEHDIHKTTGYVEGYVKGQDDMAKYIGIANGHVVSDKTENQ